MIPKPPEHRRAYQFRKRYGITLAEYNEMVERQGGRCAICLEPPAHFAKRFEPRLVVDHNHVSGEIRELLCQTCNVKLTAIEDEQFMLLAKAYLTKHGYDFL